MIDHYTTGLCKTANNKLVLIHYGQRMSIVYGDAWIPSQPLSTGETSVPVILHVGRIPRVFNEGRYRYVQRGTFGVDTGQDT